MKAKDESGNDMQTVILTKKQFIAKMFRKRIDKTTEEHQLVD